ncbi:MAG: glycosyltransferase family 2 protein [bacterium]|nr:glycosyltransferase family 2 protein [bacterium]
MLNERTGEPVAAEGKKEPDFELSVVIPCLNEAETLGICIQKAQRAMSEHRITGEVIVADNGSTDGSREIADELGARVVPVTERGYGSALMGGIDAARGRYVIMGDADDSYDFTEVPRFVDKLREGYDFAQGCRLPGGGGRVLPGAMPFLHRFWGNPMLTYLVRRMFQAPIRDVYCGLRGFTKEAYDELGLRCTGMEFAAEMVIKGSLFGKKFAEIPITLHPDGRSAQTPHLRTFRDGWRTLRFFLMYSPRWLFLWPGILLILLGLVGYAVALPGVTVFGAILDVHTLLFASLAVLVGYQSVQFAVFAKAFAVSEKLVPGDPKLNWLFRTVTLERGLVLGVLALLVGLSFLGVAVNQWRLTGFGPLDYARSMRWVIPGVTLSALGVQTVLSGFFLSILGMARK